MQCKLNLLIRTDCAVLSSAYCFSYWYHGLFSEILLFVKYWAGYVLDLICRSFIIRCCCDRIWLCQNGHWVSVSQYVSVVRKYKYVHCKYNSLYFCYQNIMDSKCVCSVWGHFCFTDLLAFFCSTPFIARHSGVARGGGEWGQLPQPRTLSCTAYCYCTILRFTGHRHQ